MCDVKSKISRRVFTWSTFLPAKFHPDPVWSDEDSGFFCKALPQQKEQQQQQDEERYEISSW